MRTWKLVSGILSLILAVYGMFVGTFLIGLANARAGEVIINNTGSYILFLALFACGIVSIQKRSVESIPVDIVIIVLALIGAVSAITLKILIIWVVWCVVVAAAALLDMRNIKKRSKEQE